jgi:hypothetical protein
MNRREADMAIETMAIRKDEEALIFWIVNGDLDVGLFKVPPGLAAEQERYR